MAKITLPLMSITGKGKLGDVVFMRRLGKNVARLRVVPHNPQTTKQMIIRENLRALHVAFYGKADTVTLKKINTATTPWTLTDVTFNKLTDTERQAWKYVWNFVGANQKRLYQNLDPVRTP